MGIKIIDRIGEINYNTFGSKMIIINQYRKDNKTYIDVYFPEYDWTFEHTKYDSFKKGNLRCPYERRVLNVGYLGEGEYKVWENNGHTRYYDVWSNMLKRCYDVNNQERNIAYKDCFVCEEWHNFQNFAKFYDDNYYEIEGERTELDKDILFKNNKIYSPNTCIFVPAKINQLFKKRKRSRGNYPIGVSRHERDEILEVWCRVFEGDKNKNIYLGRFPLDKSYEAFQCYKQFKENYIKEVADEYYSQGLIPEKLYQAMYNYEVEITD